MEFGNYIKKQRNNIIFVIHRVILLPCVPVQVIR